MTLLTSLNSCPQKQSIGECGPLLPYQQPSWCMVTCKTIGFGVLVFIIIYSLISKKIIELDKPYWFMITSNDKIIKLM